MGSIIILFNILISAYHLYTGDVLFHTDIARDFLLMENMIANSKLDLIGPRAGGIPGMFFGPIWYWATLPIFIIGNGNPIVIGIFWFLLTLILLIIVFMISKKIFGRDVGFISLVVISFYTFNIAHGFMQDFGSLLLSPFIFYSFYRFYTTRKLRYFLWNLLITGFTFQFQPAFAMLILLTTFIISIPFLIRIKKIHYLLSYTILLIPFSTYIIFELRHNFLEIRAFISFLFNNPIDSRHIPFKEILLNRFDGFLNRLNILQTGTSIIWITITFLLINAFILYTALRKKIKGKEFYLIFYIYYFMFWIFSFIFKGIVWDFYHWAFLPLIIIIYSSLYNFINKKIFFILLIFLSYYLFNANIISLNSWKNSFTGKNSSSWLLNYQVAKYIYSDAKTNFGYFIYSPDEFGFSMRYGMNYAQKSNRVKGDFCHKSPLTYLIYYPDSEKSSGSYWKTKKVNISIRPKITKIFGEIKIEIYNLNTQEISVKSDPNLLCDLSFR